MRALAPWTIPIAMTALASLGCSGRHDRQGASGSTERGAAAATKGEAPTAGGTLTIKGSDTMVILAQRWAERYMQTHRGTTLQVSGGGSGTGIAALINGTTDIANASRPMKDDEKRQLQDGRHAQAHETRVALDALAVYVNIANPVRSISIPDLKRIFTGEVTRWNQVGGPNQPIVLYSRENNSGTYAYFKEHVLDDADFAATAQTLPGTAAVINAVTRDRNGIGYGGIAYSRGVKPLPVAPEGGEPIEPTMSNATSGRYPLSRFLYMYTAGEPTGVARDFISWATSAEGQRLVENVGFYPLPRTASLFPEVPAAALGE